MASDFVVNVNLRTKGVTEKGFGTILILDNTLDTPFTLVNGLSSLPSGYATSSAVYKMAARIFGQSPAPQEIAVVGVKVSEVSTLPGNEYPTDQDILIYTLDQLIEEGHDDWFILTCVDNADATITALANWIDTQERMYFATTQTLALLEALESAKSAVGYHDEADAYMVEGLAAVMAVKDPGSATAKFKTINGVSAASITQTELAQLHKDFGFSYIRKMGVLQTTEGYTTNGGFIDLMMGAMFIKARIEEETMLMAINNDKIPYTNEGIAMLVGVVQGVLLRATAQGIILDNDGVGEYNIDYIAREDMPKNKVANRDYDGITVTATVAGAIHTGVITIDLVL